MGLTISWRLAMMRIVADGSARKTLKRSMCWPLAACGDSRCQHHIAAGDSPSHHHNMHWRACPAPPPHWLVEFDPPSPAGSTGPCMSSGEWGETYCSTY